MKLIVSFVLVCALGLAAWWGLQPAQTPNARAQLSDLQSVDDTSKYARALSPRPFVFPLDHGPHPEFQTEWWYYTGNATDERGRHFGYQLTIFRRTIAPATDAALANPASWVTNQIYFAHFAVTDSTANTHEAFERLERGGAGLAGADGQAFKVWIQDWRVDSVSPSGDMLNLVARNGQTSINLKLASTKPVVKQGDDGLSQKSAEAGNASYYYSYTRMATTGTIETPSGSYTVSGTSWMDHEWSTSALGKDAVGWDWFALQLNDNREIMLYKLRNADGTYDPVSGGTLVDSDGTAHRLGISDFAANPLAERWHSPKSEGDYPLNWTVNLPKYNLTLAVTPRIQAQEMGTGSGIYWEGAITVQGTSPAGPISGIGYLELTGYKGTLKGKV